MLDVRLSEYRAPDIDIRREVEKLVLPVDLQAVVGQ